MLSIYRATIFQHPGKGNGRPLRPLHVEIHGGSFIGGAVVVSTTYRFAPEHSFPRAIDDVDAAIKWIQHHAERGRHADDGQRLLVRRHAAAQLPGTPRTCFQAAVSFHGALDLRLEPGEKPKPAKYPRSDPLQVLLPLFDAYAQPARAKHMDDARPSPALARREILPDRMLLVVAAIDILYREQMAFEERLNTEARGARVEPVVETFVAQDGFHGYLEVPDAVVKEVKVRRLRERSSF